MLLSLYGLGLAVAVHFESEVEARGYRVRHLYAGQF